MSFARLWLILAVALPVLVALLVPLPAVDLAYQVRAGDLILATGQVPITDTFTFTVAGEPWADQQWLAQVALALGHGLGGWELLATLRAVDRGGQLSRCLIGIALARGVGPRSAAALSLAGFVVMAPALALRPQLFGDPPLCRRHVACGRPRRTSDAPLACSSPGARMGERSRQLRARTGDSRVRLAR